MSAKSDFDLWTDKIKDKIATYEKLMKALSRTQIPADHSRWAGISQDLLLAEKTGVEPDGEGFYRITYKFRPLNLVEVIGYLFAAKKYKFELKPEDIVRGALKCRGQEGIIRIIQNPANNEKLLGGLLSTGGKERALLPAEISFKSLQKTEGKQIFAVEIRRWTFDLLNNRTEILPAAPQRMALPRNRSYKRKKDADPEKPQAHSKKQKNGLDASSEKEVTLDTSSGTKSDSSTRQTLGIPPAIRSLPGLLNSDRLCLSQTDLIHSTLFSADISIRDFASTLGPGQAPSSSPQCGSQTNTGSKRNPQATKLTAAMPLTQTGPQNGDQAARTCSAAHLLSAQPGNHEQRSTLFSVPTSLYSPHQQHILPVNSGLRRSRNNFDQGLTDGSSGAVSQIDKSSVFNRETNKGLRQAWEMVETKLNGMGKVISETELKVIEDITKILHELVQSKDIHAIEERHTLAEAIETARRKTSWSDYDSAFAEAKKVVNARVMHNKMDIARCNGITDGGAYVTRILQDIGQVLDSGSNGASLHGTIDASVHPGVQRMYQDAFQEMRDIARTKLSEALVGIETARRDAFQRVIKGTLETNASLSKEQIDDILRQIQ